MSGSKHTAGWKSGSTARAYVDFRAGDGHYLTVVGRGGRPVAFVLGTKGRIWREDPEADANVALVLAAPDLLEAARKADAVLRTMYPTVISDRDAAKVREAFDGLSVAIAKATRSPTHD